MHLEEERLFTRKGAGKDLLKIRLTSMGEKLSVDLFECFFIDHTTGALLHEGETVSGGGGGMGAHPRRRRLCPSLGFRFPHHP